MSDTAKEIFCRIERCVGCRSCELACAVEHSKSKDLVAAVTEDPPPVHRVQVRAVDEKGTLVRLRSVALQCRQCEEPACVEACIAGGIVRDAETGLVKFQPEKCVGCWSCTMVCPYGAVVRVSEQGHAVKCDRCPDRDTPACVLACPTRALLYCTPEEFEMISDVGSKISDLAKGSGK